MNAHFRVTDLHLDGQGRLASVTAFADPDARAAIASVIGHAPGNADGHGAVLLYTAELAKLRAWADAMAAEGLTPHGSVAAGIYWGVCLVLDKTFGT